MASTAEPLRRDPFAGGSHSFTPHLPKELPILPSVSVAEEGDPMDVSSSTTTAAMGPPNSSPNGERSGESVPPAQNDQNASSNGSSAPVGAAAAATQPKVVQTAFIHKLYNMLEDQSIQHLISWSNTNESFVMSPSSEFAKVLAQYFKHTNISSFVRQLNMYGFHKVSDVFHTASPDSPLWEFKHGAGNFKRGDLVGLREIKRRASRHALIHRDSFSSAPKMPTPQPPGAPGAPIETVQDPVEARFNMVDWNTQELGARLARTEEAFAAMTSKCHALIDGLAKSYQWNQELAGHLLHLVPEPENPIHRDISAMRQAISRQIDQLRSSEDHPEPLFPNKQSFFTPTLPMEPTMQMSPRQRPFDESRRPSLQGLPRPGGIRANVPPYLQGSPRRYGSIGTANGAYSPSSNRPGYHPPPPLPPMHQHPPPPPPPQQAHANAPTSPSNLGRRHTSADIRLSQSWEGGQPPAPEHAAAAAASGHHGASPYASGQSSSAWPSSPRTAANPADQQIRDTLAQYELPRVVATPGSRAHSPNPHENPNSNNSNNNNNAPSFASSFGGSYANRDDTGWQLPGARYPFKGGLETPAVPSRRSSMASNVHSLLNPADTAEREGEDEGPEERKRKRVM